MINRDNSKQKSLQQRFLLILGGAMFLVYLTLGIMVIFWEKLQLPITPPYRIALGCLLIVYAIFRFTRLFKKNEDD